MRSPKGLKSEKDFFKVPPTGLSAKQGRHCGNGLSHEDSLENVENYHYYKKRDTIFVQIFKDG